MATRYRRARQLVNFWPGYVDGLAGLLMMMLFLLLFYVLGELALSTALDNSVKDSKSKSTVINELLNQLSIVENTNASLEDQIQSQRQKIKNILEIQKDKTAEIASARQIVERLTIARNDAQARLQSRYTAYLALKNEFRTFQDRTEITVREQQEQLGFLSVSLNQEAARLKETESTLAELQKDLADSQKALTISEQRLATLIAKRDSLKVALAETKQSLGETVTTQADQILVLDQRLSVADELSTRQAQDIESLSEEQVLLVGRLENLEVLEKQHLNTLTSLNVDIVALQALRAELQNQLGTQSQEFEQEHRSLVQSLAEMKLLNRQIGALNEQLKQVNQILAVREKVINKQNIAIEDLGRRLNLALASEVNRLQRYRSDFFGRMREIVANRPEIKVVNDRFILQSEVLFPSSSAELTNGGRKKLASIAAMLIELLAEVPPDLPWILRVDGHTDTRPISTPQFPSNWELSAARAIAVVRYLRDLGIPETRLAATGFADLHPIEDRDDEIAHRRNRRIEMKLTQR
ncbi:MAG: OmpA family protein [Alphaproteobacteria bacterium]|nr:OmpA family protein [Alphaproteobacteria bacterium]